MELKKKCLGFLWRSDVFQTVLLLDFSKASTDIFFDIIFENYIFLRVKNGS